MRERDALAGTRPIVETRFVPRAFLGRLARSPEALGWAGFGLFGTWFAWRLIATWVGTHHLDDQLIVLRYARNLVEGNGLVYNLGERVMGFTTPLWTLLSTLFVAFGGDSAPAWQNTFGVCCLLGTAALAARLLVRIGAGAAAPLTVSLLFFAAPAIPRYPLLGMEVHLFTLLYLLAQDLHLSRRDAAAGILTGALFLTRPEGALLAIMLLTDNWMSTRLVPLRQAFAATATVLPWLAFAFLYFGTITPATLKAKQGIFPTTDYIVYLARSFDEAAKAVVSSYTTWPPLVAIAGYLLALLVCVGTVDLVRRKPNLWPLPGFPLAIVLGYAVLGSWPGFYWHFYPVYVAVPILVALGLHTAMRTGAQLVITLAHRTKNGRSAGRIGKLNDGNLATTSTVVLVALAIPPLLHTRDVLQSRFEPDPRHRTLAALGTYLRDHYEEEVRVLVDEIGYIGWISRLHIVDSQGLVTADLNWDVPRIESLDRHVPDLVLVQVDASSRPSMDEIAPWMYRLIEDFDVAPEYRLYSKIDPEFRYEMAAGRDAFLRYRTDAPAAQPVQIPMNGGPASLNGFLDDTAPEVVGAAADNLFQFNGWAIDPSDPNGIEAVVFLVGDAAVGSATVDLPRRPDVVALYGRGFEYSGFAVRAKANRDLVEREGVTAYAVSRRGFAHRLGFHYRPLARSADGTETLPTSDGRKLRIQSPDDLLNGNIDMLASDDGQTRIRGWAADIGRGERPRQIVVYRNGHFLTNLGVGVDRPDVAQSLGDDRLLQTGFGGVLPGAFDPETLSRSHRVFAVTLRGVALELPIGP